MINIDNNKITLTRGDTFTAQVKIYLNDNEYTPAENDVVRFYLKRDLKTMDGKKYKDADPLITKEIPISTMILRIDSEDTKPLAFGDYVYDIEITFADGRIDTFINNEKFKIVAEVG